MMLGKRRLGFVVGVSVISVVLVIAATISFFPRSVATRAQCLNGAEPPSGLACPYIYGWEFLESGAFKFQVENEGQVNITLSSATISGHSGNVGFTGSVTFSLNGTVLSPSASALFTSPVLQNLQPHDNVTVIIRCASGVYSAQEFTD